MIDAESTAVASVSKHLSESKTCLFQMEVCISLQQGLVALESGQTDVILTGLELPDSTGLETFSKIYKQAPEIPTFILGEAADDAMALKAVGEGAQDYLVRATLNSTMLSRVLRYAIERKKAEHRLHLAEEKYRTVFENSPAAIIVTDGRERIISWNPLTEKILGMQPEDLHLKPVSSLYPAKEWMRIRDVRVREKGMHEQIETRVFRKEGSMIDVEVSIRVLKDPEGKVTGSIGIMKDITERKKVERMKDEFISTVSHELRTPMTIIREGVSQVLDGILGPTTQEMDQILGIALEGIDRLTRIINDLLDISKLEAGKVELRREHLDLARVVEHVRQSFTPHLQKHGLKFETVFSSPEIHCYADHDKVIQVLTNLIGNALKFTQHGEIRIELVESSTEITTCVKDTGCGISEDDLKSVFQKFQQFGRTAGPGEKGTGLGLAISKGLIELHRGRVWVTSRPGQGSCFYFSLPKYTVREFFREAMEGKLRQAFSQAAHLSLLMLAIKNFTKVEESVGKEKLPGLFQQLEIRIRQNLVRKMEFASNGTNIFLVVLPGTPKEEALIVSGRIRQMMTDFFYEKTGALPVEVESSVIAFPEDGETADQLLNKLGVL